MTCKEECMEQKKDGTIKDCSILKENEQLKKEISVLLSCSNCPENKGGYICEKEYNDKCLSQKIEYIKELEAQIEKMKRCGNCKHNGTVCPDCFRIDPDTYEDGWELAE